MFIKRKQQINLTSIFVFLLFPSGLVSNNILQNKKICGEKKNEKKERVELSYLREVEIQGGILWTSRK